MDITLVSKTLQIETTILAAPQSEKVESNLFQKIFGYTNGNSVLEDLSQKYGVASFTSSVKDALTKKINSFSPFSRSMEREENLPLLDKHNVLLPVGMNKTPDSATFNPTIEEMIEEADKFCKGVKEGSISKKNTHIPFFAKMIEHNFSTLFPEKEWDLLDTQTLQDVKQFKQEMEHRIKTQIVTYEWWFYFNLRLAIAATPEQHRIRNFRRTELNNFIKDDSWKDPYGIIKHESSFIKDLISNENIVLFPTTLGTISVNDLNTQFATQSWAIGLTKEPIIADGLLMWPLDFFYHDLIHMDLADFFKIFHKAKTHHLTQIKVAFFQARRVLLSLNPQDPKKINSLVQLLDFAFFYMTHEKNDIPTLHAWQMCQKSWISIFYDFWFGNQLFAYMIKTSDTIDIDFTIGEYGAIVPDPKELGFPSYERMYRFAFSLLQTLMSDEGASDPLKTQAHVDKLLQKFTSSEQPLEPSSSNPSDLEKDLWQCIFAKKHEEAKELLTKIQEVEPKLSERLSNRDIPIAIDYFLKNDSLLSLKMNRMMDAIDNSYLLFN